MRFGVREICDVVFKAKSTMKIGKSTFKKGQPVLYIDSAKTSTIEGAATTVYAQGGKGNSRLIAWEGEKTLTFTVEDALLSPVGFSILSGAGLFEGKIETVHVHQTATAVIEDDGVDLSDALTTGETICKSAPIFVTVADEDGGVTGDIVAVTEITGQKLTVTTTDTAKVGTTVFVDFYITKTSDIVSELQIDAENFAGSFYVEASTLFRKQSTGEDMPAEITFPNVKIQSNFTFSMASTGDPSTFTFTMDAFPGYTYFDKTKKVLCVIQIINENANAEKELKSVMSHSETEEILDDKSNEYDDSYTATP